jgi:hypothetical protein
MTFSPVLVERCERLDGCDGRWLIELVDDHGAALVPYGRVGEVRQMGETIQSSDGGAYCRPSTYLEALEVCCRHRWRGLRLLFQPSGLDGRCLWPGGYDAPAYRASNQRVWEYCYGSHSAYADCDGMPGVDPRFLVGSDGEAMVETLEALESYCVIDEDDLSSLEIDRQDEAWESWGAREWRGEVEKVLQRFAPETASHYWADEALDLVPDLEEKLADLFRVCCEAANEYWQEESDGGQWVNCERVAIQLDRSDLAELTGLALLDLSQEWRREPYPWPGAEPSPLVPALESAANG